MQIEILKNIPEKKQYLRVATISNKKNTLSFLYVGNNLQSLQFLYSNFEAGFETENFEAAKKFIKTHGKQNIDAIIIDIPYSTRDIKDFQFFLKNRELLLSVAILYNAHHLSGSEIELNDQDLIDDIIDLSNWQYDFSSKISFLKKSKEYIFKNSTHGANINPAKSFSKRVFDIAVSLILILLALPVLIIISIAIKLESKGPIFYNAKRAGRGFKIFRFYKFRTMEMNADKKIDSLAHLNQYKADNKGPQFFKISNDPRITKVGKFLRNTSLDELPQLINVLKGDMSLVGNRPLPLYEAATLTTNEFVERFMAPAGITGLWQIKKRGKSDMSTEERISLDISYARKSNLLYDFWIIAKTPGALFQKTNV